MEFIKESNDAKQILAEISSRSKMKGVSKEFTALDKAEEELIECLIEVRRLKSHYNDIKIARKKLTDFSKNKIILDLIDEIGDIYVDVFIGIPSVIPDISYEAIDNRIKKKIKKYQEVIARLNGEHVVKRLYDLTATDFYKDKTTIA